jgi:hypothetical protein
MHRLIGLHLRRRPTCSAGWRRPRRSETNGTTQKICSLRWTHRIRSGDRWPLPPIVSSPPSSPVSRLAPFHAATTPLSPPPATREIRSVAAASPTSRGGQSRQLLCTGMSSPSHSRKEDAQRWADVDNEATTT